jgi:hypothetical protein
MAFTRFLANEGLAEGPAAISGPFDIDIDIDIDSAATGAGGFDAEIKR